MNNTLTHIQIVKLGKWLEGNQDQLHRLRKSEIAEKAAASIGFAVSENNIFSACEAFGLNITRAPRRRQFNGESTSSAQFLAAGIIELYHSLGPDAPRYLRLIARRSTLAEVQDEYARHIALGKNAHAPQHPAK